MDAGPPSSANEHLLDVSELKIAPENAPAPATSPRKLPRIPALDMMRGAIMIIMAWDHAKDCVSNGKKPVDTGFEMWSGHFATYDNSIWLFFARWISHFCAPGFFWSMGVSMAFFTASRMDRFSWPGTRVCKHYLIRGVLLLVIGRFVNPPFAITKIVDKYEGRTSVSKTHMTESLWLTAWLGIFEVMTGLGLVMITAGVLMPVVHAYRHHRTKLLTPRDGGWPTVVCVLLLLSAGLFILSNALLVHFQHGNPSDPPGGGWESQVATEPYQILLRYIIIPGAYGNPQGEMWGDIAYPLIPWLGVTWIGVAMGLLYIISSEDIQKATRWTAAVGVCSLVLFNVIRAWGGTVGNLRGYPRDDGADVVSPFIGWLNVCKYPPSVAFALLTLGMNWVAVGVFSEVSKYIRQPGEESSWTWQQVLLEPVLVFGRAPLFFYVLHFWMFGILGGVLHIWGSGLDLAAVVPCWLTALVILFFLTRKYGAFKARQGPESLWRFL